MSRAGLVSSTWKHWHEVAFVLSIQFREVWFLSRIKCEQGCDERSPGRVEPSLAEGGWPAGSPSGYEKSSVSGLVMRAPFAPAENVAKQGFVCDFKEIEPLERLALVNKEHKDARFPWGLSMPSQVPAAAGGSGGHPDPFFPAPPLPPGTVPGAEFCLLTALAFLLCWLVGWWGGCCGPGAMGRGLPSPALTYL